MVYSAIIPMEVNESQKSDENVQNCVEIAQKKHIELTDEIMNFF